MISVMQNTFPRSLHVLVMV